MKIRLFLISLLPAILSCERTRPRTKQPSSEDPTPQMQIQNASFSARKIFDAMDHYQFYESKSEAPRPNAFAPENVLPAIAPRLAGKTLKKTPLNLGGLSI
jgi:hypothetical protein